MRRAILLLITVNCLTLSATKAQLYLGPVIGGSLSKIYFYEDQFRYEALPQGGFDGGIMGSLKVRKNFVLNAQLLYSQKYRHVIGTNDSRSDVRFDLTSSMQYIELPIYYVLEFQNVKGDKKSNSAGKRTVYNWFVGAGPTISYWLGSHGTLKSSYLLENQIDQIDYTTVFNQNNNSFNSITDANIESVTDPNRLQFSLNISGGVAFEPSPGKKIVTTIHLTLAQTFLSDDPAGGFFPASFVDVDVLRAQNHSIRFSVAYLFDMKLETKSKGKSTSTLGESKRRKR